MGVVVDVKVCSRKDKAADAASKKALTAEVNQLKRIYDEPGDEEGDAGDHAAASLGASISGGATLRSSMAICPREKRSGLPFSE